jgi:dipeptidyl aminopeptidase/acylaminoacyl peptidase
MKVSHFPIRPLLGGLISFLALVSCRHAGAQDNARHAFDVRDLLAMERISDHQVSPDGRQIAFVRRQTDLEANKGRTDLWIVNLTGESLRRLTSAPASDFNPRWDAQGKTLWFISTRSGSAQVWRIPVDGGEAEQITDYAVDVANLTVSPDGQHIAFTLDVFPEYGSIDQTKKRLDEMAQAQASGRVYDSIFVRHWDQWKDGRRSHLFVLPAHGGQAVNVMGPGPGRTKGMDADTPSKPFGGAEEITFTPDGKGVVFSAREAGRAEPWSTDFDLYWASVDGTSPMRCLTPGNEAWDTHPLFSPDGKTLAYLAMARPGYESDRFRIVLQEWPKGTKRVLTEAWDRSPTAFCFAGDAATIYATAANLGHVSLFAIDLATGRQRVVIREGVNRSPWCVGNQLVYAHCHLRSPVELFAANTNGTDAHAITDINADRLSRTQMGEFEQFTFQGWNDETVHGFVVKPVDFDPARRYPVAFLIHGGPQGSFNNTFHYRWNPQVYAGAGYGAVMIDFHGSTGYGQAFTDSIRGDWGGKPLIDLQRGLNTALKRYPWMDAKRVGALGASYGGYMINWIAGQWPDRFRCLVNHDGNLDERMAYFDTDELWFPEWDHQGTPWTNPDGYEKHNPINYVKNWQTPMLVIHGAYDFRVVDTQGLSTFNALQRLGIPSKFLYFPDENHWVLKPHNSILWHTTVLAWLDQWLK